MALDWTLWMGLVVLWFTMGQAVTPDDPPIYRLYRHLTENYLPLHPRANLSEAVEVRVGFSIHSIMDLDGRSGSFSVQGDFFQTWRDDFLLWDPALYGDTELVILDARDIWRPDLTVFNTMSRSRSELMKGAKNYPVRISYDGIVVWGFTALVESSCDVTMTLFPFDTQLCKIRYGTGSSDSRFVKLFASPEGVGGYFYTTNGEFDIVSNKTYLQPIGQATESDTYYPSLTIELEIARRPMYYVLNLLLPCVALSMLSLLAFCLPCRSGERVSLQITVLLSFSLFQVMLAEFIPRSATGIPVLSWLIVNIMVLNAVSLAANVYVIHIYDKDPAQTMPGTCHQNILGCLEKLVHCRRYNKSTQEGVRTDFPDAKRLEEQEKNPNSEGAQIMIQQSADDQILKLILSGIKEYTRKPASSNHWHDAADVLDKVFLVLFLMLFVILSIYIFIYRYM